MQHFKIIMFFQFCLLSFALSLYSKNSFIRINETTRNVEIAFKTYENPHTGKKVKLIAMYHIGDQAFYDKVRKSMTGSTVLYEGIGLTLEDKDKAKKRISEQGESFATIYSSPELSSFLLSKDWLYTMALAFGLVHQETALKYDTAAKLIHADIYQDEINQDLIVEDEQKQDEALQKALNNKIGFFGTTFPSLCKKGAEYAVYCLSFATQLIGGKEVVLRSQIDFINAEKIDKTSDPLFFKRNDIVTEWLGALNDSTKSTNDISLVYGVKHAKFFENYLLENRFRLVKVKWVVLTSLDQK